MAEQLTDEQQIFVKFRTKLGGPLAWPGDRIVRAMHLQQQWQTYILAGLPRARTVAYCRLYRRQPPGTSCRRPSMASCSLVSLPHRRRLPVIPSDCFCLLCYLAC